MTTENYSEKTTSLPRISIITVVYNSEKYIENTIQSIVNQSYTNIEYIIIDGGSKDRTLEIISKYREKIYLLLSEPDKGLYDAMNKGLALAKGDYVWFINSGDQVNDLHVVENIFKNHPGQTLADIYYGETDIIDENGQVIGGRRLRAPERLSWKSFRDGMLVCHQSIIIKKSLTDKYSVTFKHSADYEWVLKALKKAKIICNSGQVLSKFLDGGQSKHNIVAGLKERFKIMADHYGLLPTIFRHFIIGTKFAIFLIRNKRF
jgi:glycosyltransferase involved in cell wall biosynthesis